MKVNRSLNFQAQMVRRVKAYLNHMRVITDEDKLHQMSLECEPPVGGISTHVQSLAITVSNQSVSYFNRS